jgi:hypothetical protein
MRNYPYLRAVYLGWWRMNDASDNVEVTYGALPGRPVTYIKKIASKVRYLTK